MIFVKERRRRYKGMSRTVFSAVVRDYVVCGLKRNICISLEENRGRYTTLVTYSFDPPESEPGVVDVDLDTALKDLCDIIMAVIREREGNE